MANGTTQGHMARLEQADRISYLHTPSKYTGNLLGGLELGEDGPVAHVTVFKHEESAHRVQFSLRHGGFDATVHITPSQARAIAAALFESACDAERLSREERSPADFQDSNWPVMAAN